MILTDASQDIWERRWFVLKRCGTLNEQVQLLIIAQTISTYICSFEWVRGDRYNQLDWRKRRKRPSQGIITWGEWLCNRCQIDWLIFRRSLSHLLSLPHPILMHLLLQIWKKCNHGRPNWIPLVYLKLSMILCAILLYIPNVNFSKSNILPITF